MNTIDEMIQIVIDGGRLNGSETERLRAHMVKMVIDGKPGVSGSYRNGYRLDVAGGLVCIGTHRRGNRSFRAFFQPVQKVKPTAPVSERWTQQQREEDGAATPLQEYGLLGSR